MRVEPEKRGPGESHFISLRVSARLQFEVEIASRIQRRSQASYMEWAIDSSFWHPANSMVDGSVKTVTFTEIEASSIDLWHVEEIDRLLNVAKVLPDILVEHERALVRTIHETGATMQPPRDFHVDREFLRMNLELFVKGAAHSIAPPQIAAALEGNQLQRARIQRLSSPGALFTRRAPKKSQRIAKDANGHKRTEFLTVSVPPRAAFRLEIASRMQQKSLPSYFEWALEESLNRPENTLIRADGSILKFQDLQDASPLWNANEVECFLNVAQRIPEVMVERERMLLQHIRETFQSMEPPRTFSGGRADRKLIEAFKDALYTAADHRLAPSFTARALAGDQQALAEIHALFEASYPIEGDSCPLVSKRHVRRPKGLRAA